MNSVKLYFESESAPQDNTEDMVQDLCKRIQYQKTVCSRLEQYANYLTSLIRLSKEFDIEVTKLAELIKRGKVKNIPGLFTEEYIKIFLDSLKEGEPEYRSVFNSMGV